MKCGGISSTWWVTRTRAGASTSAASTPSRRTRSSRPPRSSPAAGSSSSISSGSVISARAIWTRLRSPSDRVPKRAVGQVVGARAPRAARRPGAWSNVVVALAPATDDAVGGGHDDVVRRPRRTGCARPGRPRPARSAAAARRRRPRPAPRRGCRPRRASGASAPAASWSSVVLPAPLGPRTTQRWPSSTSQVTSSSRVAWPRTTLTPANSRTSLMVTRRPWIGLA